MAPSDAAVPRRMGIDVASSFDEAIEMAKGVTGADSSLSYFHFPPLFLAKVKG